MFSAIARATPILRIDRYQIAYDQPPITPAHRMGTISPLLATTSPAVAVPPGTASSTRPKRPADSTSRTVATVLVSMPTMTRLTGLAATCFVALMTGAVILTLAVGGGALAGIPAVVGVVAATVAWGRRDSTVRLVRQVVRR